MQLGVGGDADGEVVDLLDQLDQLGGVLELVGVVVDVDGRITAQGEDRFIASITLALE